MEIEGLAYGQSEEQPNSQSRAIHHRHAEFAPLVRGRPARDRDRGRGYRGLHASLWGRIALKQCPKARSNYDPGGLQWNASPPLALLRALSPSQRRVERAWSIKEERRNSGLPGVGASDDQMAVGPDAMRQRSQADPGQLLAVFVGIALVQSGHVLSRDFARRTQLQRQPHRASIVLRHDGRLDRCLGCPADGENAVVLE